MPTSRQLFGATLAGLAAVAIVRGTLALADPPGEPLGFWWACMSNCAHLFEDKEAQREAWWASVPHTQANESINGSWRMENMNWLNACRMGCGPKPEEPG